MSSIRDYLNLGLHRGLEACITYNDGKWNPEMFKRWSANLSGDTEVTDGDSVTIFNYPTTKGVVESLQWEMRDLCDELDVEFTCVKRNCIIRPVKENEIQ